MFFLFSPGAESFIIDFRVKEGRHLAKERIGILGGAFDPIHQGHIQMAVSTLDSCRLDRLYVIPSGDDGYKTCIVGREDRWKMVTAACTQDPRLIPSRFEIDREPSYTIDTLLALKKKHPRSDLFYIIGIDGMMKLHRWHRLEEVLPLCTFLVCPRTLDFPLDAFNAEKARLTAMGGRFSMIRMQPLTISSTEIREQLASGQPTPHLYLPVREYCGLRGLYGLECRVEESEDWINKLFSALNPKRFTHSISVAGTARHLALVHGINPRQAEEAGLLHDCAKCMPLKEMQRIAVEHSLTDDPTILSSNALMHSLVGAWVARNEYGMADPEVLDAIAYHNTGHAGMSRLAMCVCLADSIEPCRESYPLLDQVRVLSELSLERALLMSLEGTADYVRSRGKYLHPRTQETIAWLKTLPEVRSTRKS